MSFRLPFIGGALHHGERVVLALWVGALWSIGYLAVPILFAGLEERAVAGMLAGRMFTVVSFLGLGCGFALLVSAAMQSATPLKELRVRLLALMLLIVVVGEFILQPQMAALKVLGLEHGGSIAARFAMLHGIASLLYLINSCLGIVLLVLYQRLSVRGA